MRNADSAGSTSQLKVVLQFARHAVGPQTTSKVVERARQPLPRKSLTAPNQSLRRPTHYGLTGECKLTTDDRRKAHVIKRDKHAFDPACGRRFQVNILTPALPLGGSTFCQPQLNLNNLL